MVHHVSVPQALTASRQRRLASEQSSGSCSWYLNVSPLVDSCCIGSRRLHCPCRAPRKAFEGGNQDGEIKTHHSDGPHRQGAFAAHKKASNNIRAGAAQAALPTLKAAAWHSSGALRSQPIGRIASRLPSSHAHLVGLRSPHCQTLSLGPTPHSQTSPRCSSPGPN